MPDTAIRFEGDPTTFTVEKLELLAELGCRKLSCGVQSFDDAVLAACGREHIARACLDFLRNAQRVGFESVSIDLMYACSTRASTASGGISTRFWSTS